MKCTAGLTLAPACGESMSLARLVAYIVGNFKNVLKTGTYCGIHKQPALPLKNLSREHIMQQFTFPIVLTPDRKDGGFVVICRDVPEVVTQRETIDEAISEAEGALQAAIEMRSADGLQVPDRPLENAASILAACRWARR